MGPVVDTNVLLRLLLNDHPIQSAAVRRWIERPRTRSHQPVILEIVVTEMVRVLRQPPYALGHDALANAIEAVLDLPVEIDREPLMMRALELYRGGTGRDWEDSLIAAFAEQNSGGALATYDRRLAQLPGLQVIAP